MPKDIVSVTHTLLIKKKKTVAVAESCTGGLLSMLLTQNSGSSQYFIFGAVAYSNKIKERILNIPTQLLLKKGAVTKETASLMALSAKRMAKTDFGVGITGIAGPTGGAPQKPVGTVFISVCSNHKVISQRYQFSGSRSAIRKKAALQALELLRNMVIGNW